MILTNTLERDYDFHALAKSSTGIGILYEAAIGRMHQAKRLFLCLSASVYGRAEQGSKDRWCLTSMPTCSVPLTLIGIGDGGSLTELEAHIMTNLSILSKKIRQHDGLYSLNDLHKASGNEPKHKPGNFLRKDEIQALIAEISNCSDMSNLPLLQKRGANGGTYVCKELVIAYAAWINAQFHLRVLRAFYKTQNPNKSLSPPKKYNYPRKLLEQDGFITDTRPAALNIAMLSHKEYVSPLMHLLNELRTDGHDVSAAWDEAIAMRDAVLQANTALDEIYMKALRACHKPSSAMGNKKEGA